MRLAAHFEPSPVGPYDHHYLPYIYNSFSYKHTVHIPHSILITLTKKDEKLTICIMDKHFPLICKWFYAFLSDVSFIVTIYIYQFKIVTKCELALPKSVKYIYSISKLFQISNNKNKQLFY